LLPGAGADTFSTFVGGVVAGAVVELEAAEADEDPLVGGLERGDGPFSGSSI